MFMSERDNFQLFPFVETPTPVVRRFEIESQSQENMESR